MTKNNPLLQGIKSIGDRFNLNREQFYMFIKLGLPVRKINGRWYGHENNIDDFLRVITKGKPLEVPDNDLPPELYEDQ